MDTPSSDLPNQTTQSAEPTDQPVIDLANQTQRGEVSTKKGFPAKTIIVFLVVVILSSLLVGGSVFIWQNENLKKQTAELNSQLMQIENSNKELQERLELMEIESSVAVEQASEFAEQASQTAAENAELSKKLCSGVYINGVCVKATCVDSDVNEKPNDIYISGSVTYTNPYDSVGAEGEFKDKCTDGTQLQEMYCREKNEGSGNWEPATSIENCTNGCFNGACIR